MICGGELSVHLLVLISLVSDISVDENPFNC